MYRRLTFCAVVSCLFVAFSTWSHADDNKPDAKKPDAAADAKKPDDKKADDSKVADGTPADNADTANPEDYLKSKGLKRVDPFFILAGEPDLSKKMAGLDKLKKAVFDAQKAEAITDKKQDDEKAMIDDLRKKRIELRAQLPQVVNNPRAYNSIAKQINDLGDQIPLLQKEVYEGSAAKDARDKANKAREAYVEQLLASRQIADKLQEKYADLAADPKIGEMIDAYNKAKDKKLKLGPTASLTSNDKRLKKFEETVLSDAIDIRRDNGNTWEASVVINGKPPLELCIDTGSSVISLSYEAAKQVGMTPSANDPTVVLQMADGNAVEAKKVVAKSIRVGKFTVENVECAVMPPNLPDAASVLGQTFLRHFTYKIETEKSKLVITKVDSGATAGAGTNAKPK